MNIAVRLEGGLGDCLLGNRFVSAIKEKYKDAKIYAYIDSEGKTFQKEAIEILYSSMYENIKIIPSKKYKEFWVDTQFGEDNYYGTLENVPDNILNEMLSYDRFYDLHIDSLKWLDYDFDFIRYFKFFPKPDLQVENNKGDYIVLHLVSSTSTGHRLNEDYINEIITKICSFYNVYVISTAETNDIYKNIEHLPNVFLFNGSIKDVCGLISNAKLMLSTDSGFRYIAYGYGIPTLTYSAACIDLFSPIASHYIRWLLFPETCFPLNFNSSYVADMIYKIISNKGYFLIPTLQDFDTQAVRRRYTINQEKTLL
jgi:ADP-heptose:LPS heptosyltransferase